MSRFTASPLLRFCHYRSRSDDRRSAQVGCYHHLKCSGPVLYRGWAGQSCCLDDERSADSTLEYNVDDKMQCVVTVTTGGPRSYVKLLSYLEIMRDAKEFREGDALERSDQPVQ
jgi:hypothetical protein